MNVSAELSQLLVAFTIEHDNEAEQRIGPGRPWLTSLPMWSNFLHFLPDEPSPLADVQDLVPLINRAGLIRWGYIDVEGETITVKPGGVRARRVWHGLAAEIEGRWAERFGLEALAALRKALITVIETDPRVLPSYLPMVSYADGMRTHLPQLRPRAWGSDLSVLLSQALTIFTLTYEADSRLTLPMRADVIRVLSAEPTRIRALPALSGVSKECLASALKFLARVDLVVIEDRAVTLTERGRRSQALHRKKLAELTWPDVSTAARALLEHPLLAEGLEPYPDGWRAKNPHLAQTKRLMSDPRTALPQHPTVLHRGGFPDGS